MDSRFNRREFLKISSATTLGAGAMASAFPLAAAEEALKPLRVGMIGVGDRGTSHVQTLLAMGVQIPAVCDINHDHLERAQSLVEKAGQKRPEGYGRDTEDYQRLVYRDDLDAVLIATYWEYHAPMAVCAMKSGKYAAVEVPVALTVEECWDLVNTHEETGVPCMMLENWSFRRDNLAVLNMIRAALLGEIVHCHCAHSHNCIDHWFFDSEGNMRWSGEYLVKHNASQYTTHALGPVFGWMNIGCGDYFAKVVSLANRSLGINHYFATKFGVSHPNAKRQYAQGDIVSTLVKTKMGNTIVINYDMQLPRPYDNRWEIQGTEGLYNEQRKAVYLNGRSPKYEEWEPFDPYQEKYDHAWWKPGQQQANAHRGGKDDAGDQILLGHGGTDYLELRQFLKAVRNKTQTPLDVYDSVVLSVINPLSEKSITEGGVVDCPDFTRGKWETRKPVFALEAS
ncbi:MAG TPA: Gfo/Idh/MocA family oxidoreductase [Terriglobia bacterium]|nr:Gfo/Idh/MocA family oxidoreductase [Terriglobia bacterium]